MAMKPETRKELVRKGRIQWVQTLLKEGKFEQARKYATSYKLPYEEMLIAAQGGILPQVQPVVFPPVPEEPVPETVGLRVEAPVPYIEGVPPDYGQQQVAVEAQTFGEPKEMTLPVPAEQRVVVTENLWEPPQSEAMVNGWPIRAMAEVCRYPRNLRMVVVKLPDGREASMWNGGPTRRPLGYKLKVKLAEASGDPIYEELFGGSV